MPILEGIILGITIAAPIGPTNIETTRRGFRDGWKSAMSFSFGVMVALILYLALATIGLSYLTQYEIFNLGLLGFGVIVLLYLAYSGIKGFLKKEEVNFSKNMDSKKHFFPGLVLTIGNPGLLAFWTGILGANLVASKEASAFQAATLSLGIVIGVTFVFTILIFLIHKGRKFLKPEKFKYISLISGIVLLGFATKFGYGLIIELTSKL